MKKYHNSKLRGNQNASKAHRRNPSLDHARNPTVQRKMLDARLQVGMSNTGKPLVPRPAVRLGIFAEALSGYKHNGKLTTGYTL